MLNYPKCLTLFISRLVGAEENIQINADQVPLYSSWIQISILLFYVELINTDERMLIILSRYSQTCTLSLCSAATILKYAQHCSGDTIARISSSVGRRNSGLITHQFESIPENRSVQLYFSVCQLSPEYTTQSVIAYFSLYQVYFVLCTLYLSNKDEGFNFKF